MSNSNRGSQPPFAIQEDQPTGWFETLYSSASSDGSGVPWANMAVHPSFAQWLRQNPQDGTGKSALVVGCGMGDDAIALEELGFAVTAFDVSDTAIAYCRERFPQSRVNFLQADLLQDQPHWRHAFDFVLEIFTVQALPPKFEDQVIGAIAGFTAPGGRLVVIAETSRHPRAFENGPPWLLTPGHVDAFAAQGLAVEGTQTQLSEFEGADALLTTTFRRV